MGNPEKFKMPKVVETPDGISIDGKNIPYLLLNDDGTSTTKIVPENDMVKVTISFLARSYTFKNKRHLKQLYRFKKPSKIKRFILKIINH